MSSAYQLWRLRRRLSWSRDRLEDLRRRKLAELLDYCYRRIPYYRQKFEEIGAYPQDIATLEDLRAIPILEKETLRDCLEEFSDPQADRRHWISYRSSGSTGVPLELRYDPAERWRMGHTVTRELLYDGLKPWHRLVNITEPRHAAPKNRWYHRLGLMNEQFLSLHDPCETNLTELRKIQPHALIGFPSILMLIGQQMHQDGKAPLRPELLFTLAEVLSPTDREILKTLWQVEPIDLYGANEVGHIAFQCRERRGYHINTDSLHVEILDGDRPAGIGERGEVVVTSLDLRVVPVIRYRVGDVAQMLEGSCSCGCRFPLLGQIAGRSDGFIVGGDGRAYSALEISLLLKPVTGVRQYRLLQEAAGQVIVEWAPKDSGEKPEVQIRQLLREHLGAGLIITLRRVREIAPEKSGKIRSVISHLPNPFCGKAES